MLNSKIDGTYCVSQAVPDSKKKTVWITSARIQKAAVGSQVPYDSNATPQLQTSETPLNSSSASDNIVSQNNDIVNNGVRNNVENNALNLTDKYELIATKHTATGNDIWVVVLKDRLSSEDYENLSAKVKTVGGYYSRFAKALDGKSIPGFVFKSEPTEKELSVFNDFFNGTKADETVQPKTTEIASNDAVQADVTTKDKKNIAEKQAKTEETLTKAPENNTIETDDIGAEYNGDSKAQTVADFVKSKLANGEKITSNELFKETSNAYGGTMADNVFTSKDAYDASELGVNQYILGTDDVSEKKMLELRF